MKKILKSLVLMLVMLMVPVAVHAQNIYADVNGDLEVNIADINAIIDVVLDGSAPTAAADVNGDGEVNIADINAVIDYILNGGEYIDPHLLEACEKVAEVDQVVVNYYEQCETLDELMTHTADIEALDGVEYVFFDEHTSMFVKYKDFGIVSYSYYSVPLVVDAKSSVQQLPRDLKSNFRTAIIDEPQMVIANQQVRDESREFWAAMSRELKVVLGNAGFTDPIVEENLDLDFYRNGLFQYDYVFLITHGTYILDPIESWINPDHYHGVHWLLTSVEVPLNKWGRIDSKELARLRQGYDKDEVSYGWVTETRNGEEKSVAYLKVSENFINSSDKCFKHPGKGIVFNTACQSMKGPHPNEIDSTNTSLARVFETKGAGAYFGYDESDASGKPAGFAFWGRLLSGMSIINAIYDLQFEFWHDYRIDDNGKSYWADLVPYYPNQEFRNSHICEPLFDVEDLSDENSLHVILHGRNVLDYYHADYISQSEYEYSNEIDVSKIPFRYGFELSESEAFVDAISVCEKRVGDDGCLFYEDYLLVDYSQTLTYSVGQPDSKIKPNTTYWARAYVYDGQGYNYSEPITFTTGSLGNDRQLMLSKNVHGTEYRLYKQITDENDTRINPDGSIYYRTQLTLDVIESSNTETYVVDSDIYHDPQHGGQQPAMLFDLISNQLHIFYNSKVEGNHYKLNGYNYVTSLSDINFNKETVFNGYNWGWFPYYEYNNGQIIIHHFSYAGYYAMKSVRNSDGSWSNTRMNSISPQAFAQMWEQTEHALVVEP